jgi:hypothetical protein
VLSPRTVNINMKLMVSARPGAHAERLAAELM